MLSKIPRRDESKLDDNAYEALPDNPVNDLSFLNGIRQRVNALESLRSILTRTAAVGVRAVADLTYGAPSIETRSGAAAGMGFAALESMEGANANPNSIAALYAIEVDIRGRPADSKGPAGLRAGSL